MAMCVLLPGLAVGGHAQRLQPLLKALLERSRMEQSQDAPKRVLAGDPVRQGQVLSQPGFIQLRPTRNRGGAIGSRNHRADGNHDHISQSMQPIDFRPRVRQVIEEPQEVHRIPLTDRQHGESFRVEECHTNDSLTKLLIAPAHLTQSARWP